jgi:hypothetical protein
MQLISPGGSEFGRSDCEGWMRAAGLEPVAALPVGDHDTLLVARKPA